MKINTVGMAEQYMELLIDEVNQELEELESRGCRIIDVKPFAYPNPYRDKTDMLTETWITYTILYEEGARNESQADRGRNVQNDGDPHQ